MDKPNILLIMADQLAAPALPFYGHPIVQTPTLTNLASQGVLFDNAYCNSPLCAPSRFSMMTGALPHRIGAYDNSCYFPSNMPTLAHYVRAAGYRTCLSGKMHFIGPDQQHGFEERLTTDIYPSDFGWVADWENPEHRPSWYHNMLSVLQAGTCVTSNQLDFDEETSYQAQRHLLHVARDQTHQHDPRPLFMTVSFTHPHDPFAITQAYWDKYSHEDIDMPRVPAPPYEARDPHSKRLYHVSAMGDYEITEAHIRNARHAYYAMISYIDDKIAALLQTLEDTGMADNTIIIVTADHGEMLGEHGLWYKMSFLEWSSHVPLIIHYPKQFDAKRIAAPVSLLDLLPTLTDIAHQHTPENPYTNYKMPIDGQSLLSMCCTSTTSERPIYAEYLGEGVTAPMVMIRQGHYKYIHSALHSDPEWLFDLSNDPHETTNVAADAKYGSVLANFQQKRKSRWNLSQIHKEVLQSQHTRRFIHQAEQQGNVTHWDYQPLEDATQRYMRNHLDLNVLEKTARYPTPSFDFK